MFIFLAKSNNGIYAKLTKWYLIISRLVKDKQTFKKIYQLPLVVSVEWLVSVTSEFDESHDIFWMHRWFWWQFIEAMNIYLCILYTHLQLRPKNEQLKSKNIHRSTPCYLESLVWFGFGSVRKCFWEINMHNAHTAHTQTPKWMHNAHWNRTWSFAFQMKLYTTWGIIIAKRMKRMHLHAYSNSSWSIIMSWWTNGYSRFRILPMGVQSNVHRYNWHMHLSKGCCRVLSPLCVRNVRTAHTRSPCTLDNWSPFVSVFMRTTDEKKVNSVNIFELRTVFANSNYGSPFKPCASAIERCDFEILSRLFCFWRNWINFDHQLFAHSHTITRICVWR